MSTSIAARLNRLPPTRTHRHATIIAGIGTFFDLFDIFLAGVLGAVLTQQFALDQKVSLDVDVKHVETLIVKVFQINTQNYYRENLAEIDTDVNLDGLVANQEATYTYQEPPLRRVRRHFEFPAIEGRGVYVIDFIGNGKSSRALVRKGRLHALVRTSTAGQVFTVLDEQNQQVKDAAPSGAVLRSSP